LILVSNKETQRIFLTSDTKTTDVSKNIDLILSPEFYWVRKFEIPVKTETQARHVLPTLFEDIISDTSVLTYQVIKQEENLFLCFAYNNKKIYEAIKKSNIPTLNISSVYFAQNECYSFNSFKIDNSKFMYTSENILVKVPNNLLDDVMDLKKILNNINISSNKVQIKLYNNVINSKYYSMFFIFLGVLIVLNAIKYFDYSNEISKIDESIIKIKKVNNLPNSTLQTSSILKKYEKQVILENKKREVIAYIISNRKFDLKSLDIANSIVILEYLSVNKKEVERFINKKYKVLSSQEKSFMLKVKVKL
jgi:hypothetical protein